MPMSVNCETCGAVVTRPPSQMKSRVFCSKGCAYTGLKLAEPTSRRNVYLPDHPLAGVNGYVAEHRAVLFDLIGPGEHPCHWCGKHVRWTNRLVGTGHAGMLVVDHVNANGLDNRVENLVPSCQGCNASRPRHIQPDEPHVAYQSRKRRGEVRTCQSCAQDFVFVPRGNRPGRFCSRSCYYAGVKAAI